MLNAILYFFTFACITLGIAGFLFTLYKKEILVSERANRFLGDHRLNKEKAQVKFKGTEEKYKLFQSFWDKGIEKLNPKVSKDERKKLDAILKEAGNPFKSAVEFRLFQFVLSIGLSLPIVFLVVPFSDDRKMAWLLGLTVALLGFRYPVFYLGKKKKLRIKEINKAMPDFFDTVNLLLESGMGLDAAIAQVCQNTKSPLSDEFKRTLEDMKLGKSRREAFYELRKRVPSDSFQSIITSLIQADQLGIGMAKVLGNLTVRIREQRRESAREQAMKAPVKMLFPMVFFIFPSLFIVILGPMVIQLVTKGLGG